MNNDEERIDTIINAPMSVGEGGLQVSESSDEIIPSNDAFPMRAKKTLPNHRVDSSVGEPVRVTEIHDRDIDESMSGGFASVKGTKVRGEGNRLLWTVVIVMSILCIAVGVCSSVLTGYFMRRGVALPSINTDNKQSIAAVVAARKPAITEVVSGGLRGSGVCMKYDKGKVYVITNKHVLGNLDDVVVRFCNEDEGYKATLVGYSTIYDIALLSVEHDEVYILDTPEIFVRTLEYDEGDYTVAIGNAMGLGIAAYDGIISKSSDIITSNGVNVPVMRTTSAINAGMSGGALFDMEGHFLGLGTYRMSVSDNGDGQDPSKDVEDTGFVTPVSIVYDIYYQLLEYGKGGELGAIPMISYYGSSATTATGGIVVTGKNLGFTAEFRKGRLTVVGIDSASPVPGMEVGDVIVKIGKTDLYPEDKNPYDLCRTVGEILRYRFNTSEGDRFTLGLLRGDQAVSIEIEGYYGYVR